MFEFIKQGVDAFVNLKPKESMEDQQKKNSEWATYITGLDDIHY